MIERSVDSGMDWEMQEGTLWKEQKRRHFKDPAGD